VLVADVLYIGGIFPVYYGFLPIIHSWSFVHQSSMQSSWYAICC